MPSTSHHVTIIGGGFGGLYAAKALGSAPGIRVTLVDRRNFHLFQPLLYQVATGGLSPGDVASPLRAVLKRHQNITVYMAEVRDIDPKNQRLALDFGTIAYDSLIVATGSQHHYFHHSEWKTHAPGLKTIEDALEMRRRILTAFERAECESESLVRQAWLTFVVVGGGPTGVELAGALAELARGTLAKDFRQIDPKKAKIVLIEGTGRILPGYPPSLSRRAAENLSKLGVTVCCDTLLTQIDGDRLVLRTADQQHHLTARTVLWAAGVKVSKFGAHLAQKLAAKTAAGGRIIVNPDLSIPGYPNVFVIGDLAYCLTDSGKPLPGVAPVAMQQGRYVARLLKKRAKKQHVVPFRYRNKGNLAVIGRNAAVADFGRLRFSGFPAWLIWVFVHIAYLIEFDNKILVLFQWAWNYFTRNRGARLITQTHGTVEQNQTNHSSSSD